MVFIQSQEYIDTYGKKTVNCLSLDDKTNFKYVEDPDTNKIDVCAVNGDFNQFIFTIDSIEAGSKILQNILSYHSSHEGEVFVILDVNVFMMPKVENAATLEEIEDLITNILTLFGYSAVARAWEDKKGDQSE